jgi:outer membrane biosynthesis protein TonB
MALEEKMKAKAAMDKQKEKEKIQKEKERAKQQAEREKENAKKQKQPKIKEVGNKAVRTRGGGNARSSQQARGGGGGGGIPVRFHTTLASKDKLHSFVLSVGKGVEIHDE